jgi:hypothetical protein
LKDLPAGYAFAQNLLAVHAQALNVVGLIANRYTTPVLERLLELQPKPGGGL